MSLKFRPEPNSDTVSNPPPWPCFQLSNLWLLPPWQVPTLMARSKSNWLQQIIKVHLSQNTRSSFKRKSHLRSRKRPSTAMQHQPLTTFVRSTSVLYRQRLSLLHKEIKLKLKLSQVISTEIPLTPRKVREVLLHFHRAPQSTSQMSPKKQVSHRWVSLGQHLSMMAVFPS